MIVRIEDLAVRVHRILRLRRGSESCYQGSPDRKARLVASFMLIAVWHAPLDYKLRAKNQLWRCCPGGRCNFRGLLRTGSRSTG